MAEPDLTSFARSWADRTTEPEFDALVGRARARRRRRVLALVASAAAVVLIAGLSTVLLQRGPAAAPLPTDHPTPAKVDRTSPSWIVAHGRLVSYAAGLGGWASSDGAPAGTPDRVMTVWQHCRANNTRCGSAWQLTDWSGREIATGLSAGKGWDAAPTAYASGNTFVLKSWNRPAIVVGPDGRSQPVADAAGGNITAGDLLVRTRAKGLAVVDPRSATTWDLPGAGSPETWEVGVVGSDGTTWLMPMTGRGTRQGTVALQWLRDAHWHQHLLWDEHRNTGGTAMPGVLAVSGQHVAAVSSFDGATLMPVGTFAVSADAGLHWTDLTKDRLPFGVVDSMAATSGGTLYVVGVARGLGQWRVFRSTDATWTHFESVPAPPATSGLQPAGPVVLAVSGSGKDVRLLAFDDHGMRPEVPIR